MMLVKTIKAIFIVICALISAAKATTIDHRWERTAKVIAKVSHQSGEDPVILAGFISAESSFRACIKAQTSSAKGHVQFIDSTWRTMIKRYGDNYKLGKDTSVCNTYANIAMGAEYIKENRSYMEQRLKRKVTSEEVYLAHVLSPEDAVILIRTPVSYNAAKLFPKKAAANRSLFYYKNGSPRPAGKVVYLLKSKYHVNSELWAAKARSAYSDYVTTLNQAKQPKIEYTGPIPHGQCKPVTARSSQSNIPGQLPKLPPHRNKEVCDRRRFV